MQRVEKRLSQVLGAMGKDYSVDTHEGSFPIVEMIEIYGINASGILLPTPFTDEVQEITSGITQPLNYQCLLVSGMSAGGLPDVPSGVVTIYGKDWAGRSISEDVEIVGQDVNITSNPFKSVDMIKLPVAVGPVIQGVGVGTVAKYGLTRPMSAIDTEVYVEYATEVPSGILPSGTGPFAPDELFMMFGGRVDTMTSGLEIDREFNTIGGEHYLPEANKDVATGTFRVSYRTDIF